MTPRIAAAARIGEHRAMLALPLLAATLALAGASSRVELDGGVEFDATAVSLAQPTSSVDGGATVYVARRLGLGFTVGGAHGGNAFAHAGRPAQRLHTPARC